MMFRNTYELEKIFASHQTQLYFYSLNPADEFTLRCTLIFKSQKVFMAPNFEHYSLKNFMIKIIQY